MPMGGLLGSRGRLQQGVQTNMGVEQKGGVRAYIGRVQHVVEQRGVCNRVVKREKGVEQRRVFNKVTQREKGVDGAEGSVLLGGAEERKGWSRGECATGL
jgi:hypothetical protein